MSTPRTGAEEGQAAASPTDVGRQLSAALRDSLEAGDLDVARTLATEGDGVARDLADEYAQMHRGLGVTVRILLDQVSEQPSAATSTSLTGVVARLCEALGDETMDPADGSTRPSLRVALDRARSALDELDAGFASDQRRRAAEVVAAIDESRVEVAVSRVAQKQAAYRRTHDPMIRFMAETFAWVFEHHGADALLTFHLETAEHQRPGFERWERLPTAAFAQATAFLLRQHLGEVAMVEDDEKFTIRQTPCGSGGRLRRDGAYAGSDALPLVQGRGPLTFGEQAMPVYCTHCAIWNGSATLEWFGRPQWVFDRPAQPDGSCTLHIYKQGAEIPTKYVERVSLRADRVIE